MEKMRAGPFDREVEAQIVRNLNPDTTFSNKVNDEEEKCTLCYLISNVNPPEKPDTYRFEDAEYFMTANEVRPNDNIGYGLERAYDAVETDQTLFDRNNNTILKSIHNNTDVSKWLNKTHIHSTKGQTTDFKSVTKSIRYVKDLRRSISEGKKLEYESEAPRLLRLKIKGSEGQPGIEIKLVSEKIQNKRSRKYRSFGTKIKNTSNSSSKIRSLPPEAPIVLEENGTFILSVSANSIAVFRENNTVPSEFDDNYEEYPCDNNNLQDINTADPIQLFVLKSSTSNDMESINKTISTNFNQMNNNVTKTNFSRTQNSTIKNVPTSLFRTKSGEFTLTTSNSEDQHIKLQDIVEQRSLYALNDTMSHEDEGSLSTAGFVEVRHALGNEATVLEANANANSSSLVDLLIPEATASLTIGS
ncbi:jg5166 [Pararge aegeria aegeria]|uniref:Jg5166 protein n=1 Tax=Pararge aegeria aegeria TaxID=348720 RepID=A0A8S4S5V9_9NEOP|nr:jg5166 [Pararge aegeria aegeria]